MVDLPKTLNQCNPSELQKRVEIFLGPFLHASQPLLVGYSGGLDSTVLLHLLSHTPWKAQLLAFHVLHGLSPHADQWAEHCLNVSNQFGVACRITRVQLPMTAGRGVEDSAREARYQAFAETGISQVCLAHHAGDQAETVLFNAFRGAGVSGLAGMRGIRQRGKLTLLRPLLSVSRSELEAYALAHGLSWIEDESNQDQRYARNFMRKTVVPQIASRFSMLEKSLGQLASHCAESESLLDELAALDWSTSISETSYPMEKLRTLTVPRIKNLIRYRLRCLGWYSPSSQRLEEFVRQLQTAGKDRHPELVLKQGKMQVKERCLHWFPEK